MLKNVITLIAIILMPLFNLQVAADTQYSEPVKMRITCYLPTGNPTASGVMPRKGMCAAKRDWIGKTAVIYDMDMKLIGIFEITDTGGAERIKQGKCIDLFMPTMAEVNEYIRTYGDWGYVQIITADG